MNWKMKFAAALLAVAAAAPASAALTTASGSTFGSLFVTVFDTANSKSYSRDLGILGGAFNPAVSTTFSVNGGDTNWTSFLSGAIDTAGVAGVTSNPATLLWNIATTNNLTNLQNSYITAKAGSTTTITNAGEGNLAGAINNFTGFLNGSAGVPGCGASGSSISCYTNQAGAQFNGSNAPTWGTTMAGYAQMDTTGLLSDQLNFYNILRNGSGLSGNSKPATVSVFNQGYWTINASNASVTWNASVAAVPVPAAVWLLGSGLMGLVGIGRRKIAAA